MHREATKYGILACVDGSVAPDAATRFAAREAVLHDVPLTLMQVFPFTPTWPLDRFLLGSVSDLILHRSGDTARAEGHDELSPPRLTATMIEIGVPAKRSDNIGQEDSRWR